MAQNNKKHKLNDSDTETDTEYLEPNRFARFLVMEGTDENIPLKKLSPFAIAKGLKGIAGETKVYRH